LLALPVTPLEKYWCICPWIRLPIDDEKFSETSDSVAGETAPRSPSQELEGEYSLHSSRDKWGYSKAHISIKAGRPLCENPARL
jgi:hypothetical protein